MIRRTCKLVNGRVPVLASVSDTVWVESGRVAEIAADADDRDTPDEAVRMLTQVDTFQ